MNRRERVVVLALLAVLLLALVARQPVAGVLGSAAGAALGVAVARRTTALRRRVEARLGPDLVVDTRLRPAVVVRRAVAQVAVLGALLLLVAVVPLVGDDGYALLATAATALPLVVTARRLR